MNSRPDEPRCERVSTETTLPVRRSRSRLVWLLPAAPLAVALLLVSWPTPPAATGATDVFAAAFPPASEIASRPPERPLQFGPSDEMAETADLLMRSFEPRVLAAGPPPEPSPTRTSGIAPTPAAQPTPAPTATPAPAPTVAPTAQPTPEATAPIPPPAVQPTPRPTVTATPTPVATVAGPPPATTSEVALQPRETLLLVAINEARAAAGLSPVVARADLTDVARARSEEMIRLDYFAHFHPEGHSAYELLAAAGITFSAAGENLVKTFGDVQRSVDIGFEALWNSPTHRANMLKPNYTRVGVGSHTDENDVSVITTIFTDR